MGVEGGGRDGYGGIGDDGKDALDEQDAMKGVGAVRDEVAGLEGVMTLDGDVGEIGIGGQGLDVEGECGGEGAVLVEGMAEQDVLGLHGIGGEQEMAGGDGGKVVGFFERGGLGMAAFGATVAQEEAGDAVVDEEMVEIGEQVAETLFGVTVVTREQVDEGIEDDEAGVDTFDSGEEVGEVFGEGEDARFGGREVRVLGKVRVGVGDEGEDVDVVKVGPQVDEVLALGGVGIGKGGDDDDTALDRGGAVGHGFAGGDGGGDLEGEQAFAEAMIAVEQGDAAQRETLLPEPCNGLCGGGTLGVSDGTRIGLGRCGYEIEQGCEAGCRGGGNRRRGENRR
jgi:hypothetical protein